MGRFEFKQFAVSDEGCAMKVGTDSVLLGAWADLSRCTHIIDMGTGSGILSLMVAQRINDASIAAIEIDTAAAMTARRNFAASPWPDRITCANIDIFSYVPELSPDLLICNPPYFTDSLKSPDGLRTQARHTDSDSFGPLACISLAKRWLADSGSLAMITPADYEESVTFASAMARLNVWRKCLVSTIEGKKPSRILWQISKDMSRRHISSSMSIRLPGNKEYTPEYINLTKDFYLHL